MKLLILNLICSRVFFTKFDIYSFIGYFLISLKDTLINIGKYQI